jgi:hypothetical protein
MAELFNAGADRILELREQIALMDEPPLSV